MWISRKKYEELVGDNERLRKSLENRLIFNNMIVDTSKRLLDENKSMRSCVEELKVKYADEVKKNFELANYLSENKND